MEKGAMSIYECFFFSNGHVGYFENLECDNEASLRPLFQKLISRGEWDAAERGGTKNWFAGSLSSPMAGLIAVLDVLLFCLRASMRPR